MVKKPSYLLWSLSYTTAILVVAVASAWSCRAALPPPCWLNWELPSSCTLASSTSASFALPPWSRPYVCPRSPDSLHSVCMVPLPAMASKRGFPGTAATAAVLYSLCCSATRLRSGLMYLRKTCPWNGQASTQASVPLEYKSKMPNVTSYWFFFLMKYLCCSSSSYRID